MVSQKEKKRLKKLKLMRERLRGQKIWELEKEMEAQALKRKEIDETFRTMMLEIKHPVFKTSINVMKKTFKRAYDKKEHLIDHYFRQLKFRDEQFQTTVSSFVDIFYGLINKFIKDIDIMVKKNFENMQEVLKRGEIEANIMKNNEENQVFNLTLVAYYGKQLADINFWTRRGQCMVMIDEDRNKLAHMRASLRSFLEDKYNDLWDAFCTSLRQQNMNTAETRKEVRILHKKNTQESEIITKQGHRIVQVRSLIKRLKIELLAYESGEKQIVFRERRDRYRAARVYWRTVMIEGCKIDTRNVEALAIVTHEITKWLEDKCEQVEYLLSKQAECRKYETMKEKVLPLGSTEIVDKENLQIPQSRHSSKDSLRSKQSSPHVSSHSDMQSQSRVHNASNSVENFLEKTKNNSTYNQLWHRISKAELSKMALLREKEILLHENAMLCRRLSETNLSGKSSWQTSKRVSKNLSLTNITLDGNVLDNKSKTLQKEGSNSSQNNKKIRV